MKVLVLTPIQIEHDAVVRHLDRQSEVILDGTRYVRGTFRGVYEQFEVITLVTGSGNRDIALATERAVQRFSPAVALLTGVAGGFKDVEIGDVVVGTRFYDYEYAHESDEGSKARPRAGQYSKPMRALAQSVGASQKWWKRLAGNQVPNVVFGAIASGNKIIAGRNSQIYKYLKTNYNDTIAIEMEAAGFGETMADYPHIYTLNIRGISDLIDGKELADMTGSQLLAADHAAAFAFEVLYQLDPAGFWSPHIEVRNRWDDMMTLLHKASFLHLPTQSEEGYAPPPNRAPRELERLNPLTVEDREFIARAIDQSPNTDLANKIKEKLDSLFDFQQLGLTVMGLPAIERYKRLEAAKSAKRMVILQDYRSNSNEIKNRKVEPFHINADLDTLQAFDTEIEDNRHFRLSRIRRVITTDQPWRFERRHVMKHTDVFRIADNRMVRVQLQLDVRAYNLLTEAFPNARSCIEEGAEVNTYDFSAEVNHRFYGLLNFIMGHAAHVEVIGPQSLKQRLREQAEFILEKMK